MSDFYRLAGICTGLPVCVCASMIAPAEIDTARGTYLACHLIPGSNQPGSINPPDYPEMAHYQTQWPQ